MKTEYRTTTVEPSHRPGEKSCGPALPLYLTPGSPDDLYQQHKILSYEDSFDKKVRGICIVLGIEWKSKAQALHTHGIHNGSSAVNA